MYAADLHVHTRVSDGSMTAAEILAMARAKGVTHIAFTDHDTTKQSEDHKRLAAAYGIQAIRAVEMSAYDYESRKKVHILGYGYKHTEAIEKIGRATLKKRDENCRRQIGILNKLGFRVPEDAVKHLADDCVYKQHILDYLLKTGQSEALFGDIYWNIFKNGGPCDFDIEYPRAEDTVRAICRDGGFAVLAHPGQQDNFSVIPGLVAAGLSGIEWNHPSNDEEDRKKAAVYAGEYGLFLTGGSDFHGRYEREGADLGTCPAHETSRCLFENEGK